MSVLCGFGWLGVGVGVCVCVCVRVRVRLRVRVRVRKRVYELHGCMYVYVCLHMHAWVCSCDTLI